MTKKNKPTPEATGVPFSELQAQYGLRSPTQIKLRIIWDHVRALIVYSNPKSIPALNRMESKFRACELEENRESNSSLPL